MSDGEVARAFAQHAELSSRGDIALRRPALLNALLQVLAAIHPHADEREWQAIRAKFIGDFDKNIARTQTDCHSASDFRLGVFLAGGRVMAAAAWEALQRTLVLQLRARRQAERNSEQVQLPSGAASSSGVAAHSEPRGKLLIQRLQKRLNRTKVQMLYWRKAAKTLQARVRDAREAHVQYVARAAFQSQAKRHLDWSANGVWNTCAVRGGFAPAPDLFPIHRPS